MKKNMGNIDAAIRIILALIFIWLAYNKIDNQMLMYVLYILAGVFIITSFISFCPLYAIFKINTCPKK